MELMEVNKNSGVFKSTGFMHNHRAQGLPMSTLVIIILVVLVLVAVGLVFFSGAMSGQSGITSGSAKAEAGSAKLASTATPFKKCSGTSSKSCGDYYAGSQNTAGATISISSCSLTGCLLTYNQYCAKYAPTCPSGHTDKCVGAAGYYSDKPDCTKIVIEKTCTDAGCTWS